MRVVITVFREKSFYLNLQYRYVMLSTGMFNAVRRTGMFLQVQNIFMFYFQFSFYV